MPGLEEVADELYALPPEEFIAARTEHQRAARAAGDRDLAQQLGGLAKPSLAAWVVNLLTREQPEEVSQLVELGSMLREAQEGLQGDALRQLGQQRNKLVAAMGRQARALARRHGRVVSTAVGDQVEETLRAAIADPAAGRAVLTGRLTTALSYSGLGDTDPAAAVATPAAPAAPRRPAPVRERPARTEPAGRRTAAERAEARQLAADEEARRREEEERRREEAEARRREERQRELREARRALEEAEATADEAAAVVAADSARVAELEGHRQELVDHRDDLRRQLAEAAAAVETAEGELDGARRRRTAAGRRAERAEQDRAAAQARIDALRPTAADRAHP